MAISHLEIFFGRANQIGVSTAFPTTREDPMYIEGNDDGLDDGDIFFLSNTQIMGVRIANTWNMIQFTNV